MEYLWRGVGRRAAPRSEQLVGIEEIREAEIGDFDFHVRVEQQILGLKGERTAVLSDCK